ncbi:MAG: hypothetical protein ACREJM_08450 [Candidatus Saccharimonadales bacterium]
MKAKGRPADFDCTAAGIYAKAMEQALSATRTARQPVKLESMARHRLTGGCLLYSVPAHYWRRKKLK